MPVTQFPVQVVRRSGRWVVDSGAEGASTQLLRWCAEGVEPPAGFRVLRGACRPPDAPLVERPVGVDQTNRSVIVGDWAVVKWTVGPLAGPHPGPDRLRRLIAAAFWQMPEVLALVEWQTPDGYWVPVAAAQRYLPGATDGWTWCLREARVNLGVEPGPARPFTEALGTLAARMHRALAVADSTDIAAHGDFHVGQILRDSVGALYVIDFDGNPTVPPVERSAFRPAAYDIAGMLLSLENVGHVVRKYHPHISDDAVLSWTERVQQEFLDGYRQLAADLLDESLLPTMIEEQIHREFAYARDHLPEWRYVPEAAMKRRGR